ncbi:helix-turn-helix domain-containing protein [Haloarcula sp. 1CSR25-25]|uniref:winged helix-turn-helix transcriptional regulator n=1 Tax=Haloarcula sp. 1CSR25-25 TaxID=2862545 RepID=UPI0028950615|nr:helix-turn-helix domain-containing protein [Haloarcula sp. 1CSR25-25]MDT3437133.1 helix-turn-helix transcriptional regulator [Haloarcula sp. 1CSR25-25]
MSKSETRQQELHSKNAAACPVVKALETVGTQWRLQVLYALTESEMRFNELKRATGGRSKTLSDALEVLVDEDLIERRTEEAAPIAVYYQLSAKGETLVERLEDVSQWAVEWMDDVEDPDTVRPRFG